MNKNRKLIQFPSQAVELIPLDAYDEDEMDRAEEGYLRQQQAIKEYVMGYKSDDELELMELLERDVTKYELYDYTHTKRILDQFDNQHAFWMASILYALRNMGTCQCVAFIIEILEKAQPGMYQKYIDYIEG